MVMLAITWVVLYQYDSRVGGRLWSSLYGDKTRLVQIAQCCRSSIIFHLIRWFGVYQAVCLVNDSLFIFLF